MDTMNLLVAGFGGQGILFMGKVVAYTALIENKEVSWLPSYGPEMRGGTANCSVCIGDAPIGSPVVLHPNVLVVMNLPSLEKFGSKVEPGGFLFIDSSLIDKKVDRDDINVFYIPASQLAEERGLKGLGNMIMLGKLYKELAFCAPETLDGALLKCIPVKTENMIAFNRSALQLGLDS